MRAFHISVSFLLMTSALSSCASLSGRSGSGDPEPAVVKAPLPPTGAQVPAASSEALAPASGITLNEDEVFLRQARLNARMDEIENELKRQREKIRLLEQGLLTGIAPNDLKVGVTSGKDVMQGAQMTSVKAEQSDRGSTLPKPSLEDSTLKHVDVSKNVGPEEGLVDVSAYEKKLTIARENYQAGRFGLAIAELASIMREFGENSGEGASRLWLGKAYLGLKEYSTARVEFEAYLKGWPSGEFVAEARLNLAKCFVGLGLKERARRELKKVMTDFDGDEFSEIASLEFKKLQGGL